MMRSGQKIVVVGAGPAGLSAAVGLAQQGHEVTVLERRSEELRNQHVARVLHRRLNERIDYHPLEYDDARENMCESELFRRSLPDTLLDVPAWYFVPDDFRGVLTSRWRESDNAYRGCRMERCPLSLDFCRTHALSVLRLPDRIIDPTQRIQRFRS